MFDVRRLLPLLAFFDIRHSSFVIGHLIMIPRFTIHDSRALRAPMRLDFASALNLVSTVTLIGAL
jgi:hypothetical protein